MLSEEKENIKLAEHIIKRLAKFHKEKNTAFYKELAEELFVKYAKFQDYDAGVSTLNALIKKSFDLSKQNQLHK